MVTENTGLRPKRSPILPPKMEPMAMQNVSAAEIRPNSVLLRPKVV